MAIKYALHENYLNGTPKTYIGRVESNGTIDFDGLADTIVSQGSTVTRADIIAVFENMKIAVESLLIKGFRVNFEGLVELHTSVKGVFNSLEEGYDSSRHNVSVKARASARIKDAILRNAKMIKLESSKPSPSLIMFRDIASGEQNAAATPGNIGAISGHRLKFNADEQAEGIFLTPVTGGDEIKVDVIQRNKPKELVFLVPPALPSGSYHLDVRVTYGEEDIRGGRLEDPISVG